MVDGWGGYRTGTDPPKTSLAKTAASRVRLSLGGVSDSKIQEELNERRCEAQLRVEVVQNFI